MVWLALFLVTAYWVDPLPYLEEVVFAALLAWFRPDLVGVALLVLGGAWLFGIMPHGLLEHPTDGFFELLGSIQASLS